MAVAARLAALLLLFAPLPTVASTCGFAMAGAALAPLTELPEGIATGRAECEGVSRQMSVWTLGIDSAAPDLGLRDRPLFRSRTANPLVPVARAEIAGAGRLTLFQRQEVERRHRPRAGHPDRRPPYRLFGTFCDLAATDPLDCAVGAARIKMRADVVDSDGDGVLDRVRNQVSIWDGGGRLQVLMFETGHAGRPLGNAVPWIETLALAGRL